MFEKVMVNTFVSVGTLVCTVHLYHKCRTDNQGCGVNFMLFQVIESGATTLSGQKNFPVAAGLVSAHLVKKFK